ncbi:MFS transporter [Ostreiculturibacter nitratireducens]|uniref:MFS transporter n=1 Tax=Ostreiculturibacter nitratireducens TaxID=3075226 RepID=UPI0031B5D703
MASKLPKGVIALGFTSLFMDISSEMIHGLLPLFLTATLGASALVLGVIEGVAEATAQILKVFSGALSDRIRRRKPLAVLGYGLSAATKPLFALAGTPWLVMGARFADRVGKGIRGAPRDALIADIVEEAHRGAAYGLRQSLDTVGAFVGPIAAMVILWASGGDIRLVFAVAVIPAALAVLILVRGVREPALAPAEGKKPRLDRNSLAALGRRFWIVVAVGAVMTMARISEAFLILRANDAGLPVALAPLVLVMMNVVYSLSAWPLGALSDEPGKRGLLLRLGFAVLILSHIVLALAPGLGTVMAGVALWGLHMGLTQGLLAAEVAAHAPARLRGTAFGVFNLVTGLTLLVANGIAGAIWAGVGAEVMFLAGAGAAALGLLGMGVRAK